RGTDALAAGALHGSDAQHPVSAGDVDALAPGTEHAARRGVVRMVERVGGPDAQRLAGDPGIAARPRVEGAHLALQFERGAGEVERRLGLVQLELERQVRAFDPWP